MTIMLLLRFLLSLSLAVLADAQQITLPNGGILTGTIQTNVAGGRVHAFRGIPYAEAPVGDRRWKQATLKPLDSSLNATAFGNICYGDGRIDPQSSMFPSSEDCLFLNVYAPATATSTSKLPVFVWIHGGGFVAGASNIYDGSNLIGAAHDNLVVVTLNYRLSVFGLLSGDVLKCEGSGVNYALRDQEVAFQWVQQYISLFGGDPTMITAVGESAGAKSVFAHLIARNGQQQLFHNAILESGTYTTIHDVPTKTQQSDAFAQIATSVGCDPSADDTTVLHCLRNAKTSEVWAAGAHVGWQPVVDGVFLLDSPVRSLLSGHISRVPTIIGTNTDEGWTFTASVTTVDDVMAFVRSRFAPLTEMEYSRLDELYPPQHFATPTHRISQIYGDAIYVCPSELASLTLAQLGSTTFRYRFNHTSLTFGYPLAVHTADIRYVFNIVAGVAQDAATQEFVGHIQRYWTSFTSTSSPTGVLCTSLGWPAYDPMCSTLEWPAYDALTQQQIVLQASGNVLETTGTYMPLHAERCAFWNEVELQFASTLALV